MSDAIFDRSTLGNEASRLLEVLLGHAGEDGRAQVPTSALQKETGLTQSGLARGRDELVRNMLVRVETGYSANGLRGANVYTLNKAVLMPPSTENLEDESDQNRAGGGAADLPSAVLTVHPAFSETAARRASLLSRLFRRSRAS